MVLQLETKGECLDGIKELKGKKHSLSSNIPIEELSRIIIFYSFSNYGIKWIMIICNENDKMQMDMHCCLIMIWLFLYHNLQVLS